MSAWRVMDWLDDRYEVSDAGEVRSWAYRNGKPGRATRPHKLKPWANHQGYLHVDVSVDGKARGVSVARCVLRAFTGVFGPQANHLDGKRQHNALANLEWCTAAENVQHSIRVLGRKSPTKGNFSILASRTTAVIQLQFDGTVVRVWPCMADAWRAGFSGPAISAVCSGRRKQHGGFHWQYVTHAARRTASPLPSRQSFTLEKSK